MANAKIDPESGHPCLSPRSCQLKCPRSPQKKISMRTCRYRAATAARMWEGTFMTRRIQDHVVEEAGKSGLHVEGDTAVSRYKCWQYQWSAFASMSQILLVMLLPLMKPFGTSRQ
eukprot:9361592-Pyramimonas_sp.AAC.1